LPCGARTFHGTRASTIIALDADGHGFIAERRFDAEGVCVGETTLATHD